MNRLETTTMNAPKQETLDLESLWSAYLLTRDEDLRNRLLVNYLPLARTIARHMHTRMPSSIDYDDLAQAATLGMRSALATFDPSRGIPFERYCGTRVRGAVLDHLRSMDWAPRMLRSRVDRVREMIRQMEMSTGTTPTDEQLSGALRMPLEDLQQIRSDTSPAALRNIIGQEDDEHSVNLSLVPDEDGETPLRAAQRTDLREFLIRGLSPVERQVVLLYYYENLSLREIGETLNLCESRVSQIHLSVIKRMRERMHRIGGAGLDD